MVILISLDSEFIAPKRLNKAPLRSCISEFPFAYSCSVRLNTLKSSSVDPAPVKYRYSMLVWGTLLIVSCDACVASPTRRNAPVIRLPKPAPVTATAPNVSIKPLLSSLAPLSIVTPLLFNKSCSFTWSVVLRSRMICESVKSRRSNSADVSTPSSDRVALFRNLKSLVVLK